MIAIFFLDGYVTLRPIKVLRSTSYYNQQGPLDGPLWGSFRSALAVSTPIFAASAILNRFLAANHYPYIFPEFFHVKIRLNRM